jgi:hypothetical protein
VEEKEGSGSGRLHRIPVMRTGRKIGLDVGPRWTRVDRSTRGRVACDPPDES